MAAPLTVTDADGVEHTPTVPAAGGVRPWCSCGWRQYRPDGPILADHLREMADPHWFATVEEALGIPLGPLA